MAPEGEFATKGGAVIIQLGCEGVGTTEPSGTLTTLYVFCQQTKCTDGLNPESALIEGPEGTLYGVTDYSGSGSKSAGTIYSLTTAGVFTTLYSFCSQPRLRRWRLPHLAFGAWTGRELLRGKRMERDPAGPCAGLRHQDHDFPLARRRRSDG